MTAKQRKSPPIGPSGYTRSVQLTAKQARRITRILESVMKDGLRVPGPVNPIRPKESHILRLAMELGLPHVLQAIRDLHGASATRAIREASKGEPSEKRGDG